MHGKVKLVSSMLIFGTIGVFVKFIPLSSMDIAFVRAVIGCAFLVAAGLLSRQKVSWGSVRKNLLLLVLSGAAIGLNWILLFQAYKYTTIATATLSYYFAPVFVVILSPAVLKERLTKLKAGCIIAAMAGLFLILNIGGASGAGNQQIVGVLYGLSAAVLYAGVILMNKFIRGLSGFETTLIQLFVAGLILLPSVFWEGGIPLATLGTRALLLILTVGIVHTGAAYFLYFTSMKGIGGQSIAILSYIDPITAVVISAVILGEAMSPLQGIGGVLILGSAFLSEAGGKLLEKIRKAA